MTNFHDRLKRWGASQRRAPERNDALKAAALQHVRPSAKRARVTAPLRLPFLPLALAGTAVIALLVVSRTSYVATYQADTNGVRTSDSALGLGIAGPELSTEHWSQAPYSEFEPIPRPPDKAPIVDDRELLRTDYRATMRTRRVQEDGQRVQTIIRGHGGRIDQLSLNERYGSVSFALPEDELPALRDELRGMVRTPFLTESFHAENLLPQQQGLEQREQSITSQITELTQQLDEITTTSEHTVASLTAQLRTVRAALTDARDSAPTTTAAIVAKQERITALEQEERTLDIRIASVRKDFMRQRAELERNIADYQATLDQNGTAQQDIRNTVATVRGTITLQQITYTGMVRTYLTMYWLATLLGVLAILTFIRKFRARS
ncbi:MAG: hypothetical protein Q7S96_00220 [bacterium]|nr:hypothetical protein [bacterium]